MKVSKFLWSVVVFLTITISVRAQDYFFGSQQPFNPSIPTPEQFLGYPIGEQHTRHDQIVSYLYKLAEVSERATIEVYGHTHEKRKLVILSISSPENLKALASVKSDHLKFVNPVSNIKNYEEVVASQRRSIFDDCRTVFHFVVKFYQNGGIL